MASKALTVRACLLLVAGLVWPADDSAAQDFGPLYQNYQLTLEPGERSEVMGPFFYHETKESIETWAFPGLMSDAIDRSVDSEEFQVA
jgi:hypothetical protein